MHFSALGHHLRKSNRFQMKIIALFILTFLWNSSYSQVKINIPTNSKSESSYWYKYQSQLMDDLKLIPLQKSDAEYAFRLSYLGDAISYMLDISHLNGQNKGSIIYYTKEYVNEAKEKPTGRYFSKKTEFSAEIGDKIYQLIKSMGIDTIPSQEYIQEWHSGFDGDEYFIEHTDQKNYYFKSYWTPSVQNLAPQAKILLDFFKQVKILINAVDIDIQKEFSKSIPFENYTTGGSMIGIRIVTPEERKMYKKERDAYRKANGL
jgi:hypothetical protein